MPDKMKSLLKSRRFWLAVLGVVAVIASDGFGLDHTQVVTMGGIVVAWIVGDTVRKTE